MTESHVLRSRYIEFRRLNFRALAYAAACLVLSLAPRATYANRAAQPEAAKIDAQQVLEHLNLTIAWYGHIGSADQSTSIPQNVLLQDSVRQSSKQVVIKAFAFARAAAAFLANQKADSGNSGIAPGQGGTLEQSAALANERIKRIQSQLDGLNQQIAKAPRRKLATLVSQRDTLASDLAFAKLAQGALKDMLQFASGSEKSGGLLGQINLLATSDSIPAALSDTPAPAPADAHTAATTATFHPQSAGIAPLIANCFALFHARGQIDGLLSDTTRLNAQVNKVITPLRTQIRALISESDSIAKTATSETDANRLSADRQQIERISARFKGLSGPIVPLREQSIAIVSTQGGLEQWREALNGQLQTVLGYLAFRLGTLGAAVLLLFIISEVVRRATFRYVRDTRRRRQFVLIRRFVVGTLATIIVIIASVSGIGSFATVAGFVTAGLAVALQNVILSVVAYFFLIGRYGLKAGDRVTVSGITGQVIEVGLVRLYLMELAGAGTDIHSTGRVAVFSNSVIFQPAALLKQAPGTEYTWHTVTTTLAQETHLEEARTRIANAVEAVYKTYQNTIEQQHEAFERAANIQLADPVPVSRARLTDAGVEIAVRFPVEIQRMSEVDEKVIDSVLRNIESEPQLKLAAGGFPKVLPSA